MLSKAAILAKTARPLSLVARCASGQACPAPPAGKTPAESSEVPTGVRDEKNFPRPVRPILPGKVRMGFIPEEWFQFFYEKTGVTGPYMFGVGLTTYLCSKEVFVMEHEYYSGISLGIVCYLAVKKLGPAIASYADKEIDKIEDAWKESREVSVRSFGDAVENEKKEQWRAEGQILLMEAKKQNIALQLEAEYRERALQVYKDVKRRLDYQIEKRNIDVRIGQKHMVGWIIDNVLKSITPDQEKENINKCIEDLALLAKTAKA